MFFSRQAIYNKDVKLTANEIFIHNHNNDLNNDNSHLFERFLDVLLHEVDTSTNQEPVKLIIPQEFYYSLSPLDDEIKNKISIKLDMTKEATKNYALFEQIKKDGYSISAEVEDKEVLWELPETTEYLFIDEASIGMIIPMCHMLTSTYKVVAKNVADYNRLNTLYKIRVRHYCGGFISCPTILTSGNIDAPNKLSLLKLIATVNDPLCDIATISKLIACDSVMSFKLLKIINSPLYRGLNDIKSIQEAVMRFGLSNLKRWLIMLSLGNLEEKPATLLRLAIERATMCAKLANTLDVEEPEAYYTVGLLSAIDAFFDMPLEELIEQLALTKELKEAILHHEGQMGNILKNVCLFQKGNIICDDESLTEVFVDCAKETNELMALLTL